MHDLFEQLCRELRTLGLRPDPFRHYIAFKCHGVKVVDVVPARHRLRCYLNADPDDLEDPTGLVEDVRAREHWGNGDCHVPLQEEPELPRFLPLVRQLVRAQQAAGEPTPPDFAG